ncbi:MAG: hypothetical protein AB7P02_01800 [Alphaproteobacteria bacterium]
MIPEDDISRILAAARARGVARLEVTLPGLTLAAAFAGEAAAVSEPAVVTATAFGLFTSCAPGTERPLATPGAPVAAGDVVALLRVGDLYRPVRAPVAGSLGTALVAEGALVGHGDPVFTMAPESGDD